MARLIWLTASRLQRRAGEQQAAELCQAAEDLSVIVVVEGNAGLDLCRTALLGPVRGLLDGLEDTVRSIWLGNEVVSPDAETLDPVLVRDSGGDDRQRDQARSLGGLEYLADLVTVEIGKHQVQENDVGPSAGDNLQGFLAGERRLGTVPPKSEQHSQELVGFGFVFDDQRCGHLTSFGKESYGTRRSTPSGRAGPTPGGVGWAGDLMPRSMPPGTVPGTWAKDGTPCHREFPLGGAGEP